MATPLGRQAVPVVQVALEQRGHRRALVVAHVVPADLAGVVGQAVGESVGFGKQQQAHVLVGVAGQQHGLGGLEEVLVAFDVFDAGRAAFRIGDHPRHPRIRNDFQVAGFQRFGNGGEASGAFRTQMAAAAAAKAVVLAGRTPVEDLGGDRGWALEGVPAQVRARRRPSFR